MPEVDVAIRWADGATFHATAPSRAIERFVAPGLSYPQGELVRRLHDGLQAASERVRERYGFACTAAAEVDAQLAAVAETLDPQARAEVTSVRRRERPGMFFVPERIDGETEVAVIGGGQAGLTASWFLAREGVEHIVLERDVVASAWRRDRWDAFCLVTPNFQCRLPGHPYAGPEPDGFMVREEIVAYVEGFAAELGPPLLEGVEVRRLSADGDGFSLQTPQGALRARQVVLCVGGYHLPRIPPLAAGFPAEIVQLHSSTYRNPSSLPDGAVLVVGSGQSGAQIAEDLFLAGREVHLAVGSAPRVARRYRGRDCVAWLEDIGHYRMPIHDHPAGPAARHEPNHYLTGRDGGHDIDLRAFARDGMHLHGRVRALDGGCLRFAGDLAANLDGADATMDRIKDRIDQHIEAQGISAAPESRYAPVWKPADDGGVSLDLAAARVSTIVWATGFLDDWSWVDLPLLDESGYPDHRRGVSTRVPGLYLLGLPWLHTWGSGRFAGVAEDAEHVVGHVAARAAAGVSTTASCDPGRATGAPAARPRVRTF